MGDASVESGVATQATGRGPFLPVSVVIPAYNRSVLLERSLRSVAGQTSPPAEVIVVDDCSTDDTADVARRLGATVVSHEHNQGAATARNTGFGAATQPWVALLDSDDEWLPHHLETLWSLRGGHVLVAGSALACGDDPDRDRIEGPLTRRPVVLLSPAPLFFPVNYLPASGVAVRRDLVLQLGGYNTKLRYAEDFDLWLRVLERGSGVVSPKVVTIYHRHDSQKSQDQGGPEETQRRIAESFAGRPWWSPALVERRRAVRAWDNLRRATSEGRHGDALRHATWILRRRERIVGVARIWAWRLLVRRRSAGVSRDGSPSLAVLPSVPGGVALPASARRVWDLRGGGAFAAWARLLRRPPAEALVGARWEVIPVRMLGIRPSRVRRSRATVSTPDPRVLGSPALRLPGPGRGREPQGGG